MWTPRSRSPEATNSIAWVAQPHSGWIRNSATGWSARVAAMSSGRMPLDMALAVADVEGGGSVGSSQPELRATKEPSQVSGPRGPRCRSALAPDVLNHLDGVRRRAAVVGLGLHLRRRVHVHDHHRAGVLGLPGAELVGGDRLRQRAAGVGVGDQDGLLGRQHRRGLGHEVNAAEGDHLGVGARGLARELQRVAGQIGHVLDLGHLVVVGQDDGLALRGQGADLVAELADVVRGELGFGGGLNCRQLDCHAVPFDVRRLGCAPWTSLEPGE